MTIIRTGRRGRCLLIVFLLWFAFTGCGTRHTAETYPVCGKVAFDDGTPLTTGGVILCESVAAGGQPAFNAAGPVAADGTFRLSTFAEGDGAVAGKQRVLVRAKRTADDSVRMGGLPTSKPVLDPRFESFDTSGLEFTVEPRNNEFNIVVRRPRG